jgi:ABC-2 type transport system permease protein
MQYRGNFLIEGGISLFWLSWNLVPLFILYASRDTVAGWDLPSALVVMAWFTLLRAVLEGAINPSLVDVVERIRSGAFDYLLLKPADAQFLASTARFAPWKVLDLAGALLLLGVAFARLGRAPEPGHVAVALIMLGAAVVTMYSLWMLVASAAFWAMRLDNLAYLFTAVFDAARWPVQIFRGGWRLVFTLVIPLAVMTTYPAMALLGTLDAPAAALSVGLAAGFALASRLMWRRAVASYTSASS